MKVLMTGGTGLIGKALTESLLTDGHHVTVLTRRSVPTSTAQSGLQMLHIGTLEHLMGGAM